MELRWWVVPVAVSSVVACGGGGGEEESSNAPPTPVPGPTATVAPTAAPTPMPSPAPTREPSLADLRLRTVATGLSSPLYVTAAPGHPEWLFVVEQSGRIRIIEDRSVRSDPFLDLTDVVEWGGELGLLGLAFHPDYESNGLFYVNYTDADLVSITSEFSVDPGDPARALRESERTLLRVPQDSVAHHGGMLAFGPDGALYLSLGDSSQGADPNGYAQDPSDERGKILRIDPASFPVPLDDGAGLENPHVWHYGLRNPWRFSFDRATGDLYVGDVGELEAEEVNVVAAGVAGVNFGWRIAEGSQCFVAPWADEPRPMCDLSGLQAPVLEYGRDTGCSVIGGYVYRGPSAPSLVGRYVFADYCSRRVLSFVWEDGVATDVVDLTDALAAQDRLQSPSSFGEDLAGNLYVVDLFAGVFALENPAFRTDATPPPVP